MPNKVLREDKIDKAYDDAYDFSQGEKELRDAESSAVSGYANEGIDQLDAYRDDPANAARDTVDSKEKDSSGDGGGWTVNRSASGSGNQVGSKAQAALKIAKKGGPAGFILAALLSIGSLVSFFGGPGLLIVQIAEKITEKFDSQLASAEERNHKILKSKLSVTTNGKCSGLITARCKYSTFSKNDIADFKKAGIEVIGDKTSILGRTKATGLKFTNPTTKETRIVDAKGFDDAMRTDGAFRNATIEAHNTRFDTKHDIAAIKSYTRSKTSNGDQFTESDDTEEERDKRIQETTRDGQTIDRNTRFVPVDGCDEKCTDDKNKQIDAMDTLANDAEKVARDGIKSAQPSGLKTATSTLNAFGAIDDVCMPANLINGIGMGAKIIRNQQLIRYAMFFLTTAGQIKAGVAKPYNVSHLGNTLTKTVKDSGGNYTKSGTEAISYRYMAYGDKGSTNSSTLFKVGGGLGGDLSGIADKLYGAVGGKSTCDFVGNPIVVGTGLLVSFVPGFGQAAKLGLTAVKAAVHQAVKKIIVNVTIDQALGVFISYLTAIAADMVAGVVVDGNTFGEQSGDALVTGGAEFLTQTSGIGGNLPLTPEQAIAYNGEQERVLAMYNSYDQATLSPLDTSSSATFLGSISSHVLPYMAGMNSISGTLSTLASIPFATFTNFTRNSTAKAATVEDYTECEDYEYRDMGVATTPMCNVLRGIPTKYLGLDPLLLTEELAAAGDVDEVTGDPKSTEYIDFVKACLSGEVLRPDSGCLLNGTDADKKGRWAVHYIDQRIVEIRENGLPNPNSQTSSPESSQVANGGYALPVDQKWFDSNPNWFSKPHHDYPAADIPVPQGTPIYAMTSGKVTRAPNGRLGLDGGYGLGVSILGGDGVTYNYGHGTDGGTIVKVGDTVKAGQLIMHAGNTGHSFGTHLHVDMYINKVRHCPQTLLVALGKKLPVLPTPASLPISGCSN